LATSSDNPRRDLAQVLSAVLEDIAAPHALKRAPSVLGIVVHLWVGDVHVSHAQLMNGKLDSVAKRSLETVGLSILREGNWSRELRETGTLRLDLREGVDVPAELPGARYFFASDRSLSLATPQPQRQPRIRAWAISSAAPHTPFSPLLLRTAVARVEGSVAAHFSEPSFQLFLEALGAGAIKDSLGVLASLIDVDALAVWEYDESRRRFASVATHGMGQARPTVPASPSQTSARNGVVSMVTPDRPSVVVYDEHDRESWRPPASADTSWRPHDRTLFQNRGWRSCVVTPIVLSGRLVGAVSAYGKQPAREIMPKVKQLDDAVPAIGAALLLERDRTTLAELARRYDEELITANVSLGALSLSHDILHYYGSVTNALNQISGYLKTNQLAEAKEKLATAQLGMAHTRPVVDAMRRLASEARNAEPQLEWQSAKDFVSFLSELESLLKVILPQFSSSKRLLADDIHVGLSGEPRPIPLSRVAVERIVVNLCANSAQWRATDIEVAAHFERSASELQIVVRDDGSGIPSAVRDQIFDRFFSQRKDGSGLGLYVVRSIVARVGGEVYIQSYDKDDTTKHKGTVVTVVVPTTHSDKPSA
jgi:signal transduction histidine kinase